MELITAFTAEMIPSFDFIHVFAYYSTVITDVYGLIIIDLFLMLEEFLTHLIERQPHPISVVKIPPKP